MNFTNYYTFHITRKPNNRLANQPKFIMKKEEGKKNKE